MLDSGPRASFLSELFSKVKTGADKELVRVVGREKNWPDINNGHFVGKYQDPLWQTDIRNTIRSS